MNNTNRGLNRLFIALVGLVLIAAGAAAAAVAFVPDVRSWWTDAAPGIPAAVSDLLVATPIGDTGTSWISVGVIALLVIVVVLLLVFTIRQGNGHTGRLHVDTATGTGTTVLDTTVAQTALEEALSGRTELISSHVTSYDVRGTAVLKIAVTARRGVSPADITAFVENDLRALDRLLGVEIPALLQISGGFRTRVSSSTRLQ